MSKRGALNPGRAAAGHPPLDGQAGEPPPLDWRIQSDTPPMRLDRALRRRFPQWGRQAVGRCISAGEVWVNGRPAYLCSWQVAPGDQIVIHRMPEPRAATPSAWDERWVLYHDQELIALDKPAGLLSEPPHWRSAPNLLELASQQWGDLHLFHRLDRDASGVVLLTRGGAIDRYLDGAFKAGTVIKEYLAIVRAPNQLAAEGEIAERLAPDPLRHDRMVVVARGGQRALSRYRVEATLGDRQRLWLQPVTGRTHQLRVHLAHLGAPIVGDRLYAPPDLAAERLMLHAWQITLPAAEGRPARTLTAPPPPGFL